MNDSGWSVEFLDAAFRHAGFYKLRVGDWRVIYEVDPARCTLVVHAVKHRREAYRD